MNLLTQSIYYFLQIYIILLIVRILLTWFQGVGWANQIAETLSPITDPYLDLFRSFIPPLGGTIDISPMLAILVLQLITQVLSSATASAINYYP
jgi:YggT family protein